MAYRRTNWRENETPLGPKNLNNIEEGIQEALAAAKGNTDLWHYIRNLVYPVGSIYISTDSTNPGERFGGTWVAWGSGRVPVGVSTAAEFNTVEKTGGEKTHTLSESEMPRHNHTYNKANPYTGEKAPGSSGTAIVPGIKGSDLKAWATQVAQTFRSLGRMVYVPDMPDRTVITGVASHTHTISTETATTGTTGNNGAHNNLQPYITCYMWKRIA